MSMKTILVTTDLSDFSKKAFPHALDLARKYEAKIVVCYVEEHRVPPLVIEYPGVGFDDMMEHQRERAKEHLQRLVEEQLGKEMEPELRVIDGIAHVGIVQLAREIGADMIVIASHDPGIVDYLLGSVAARVVRHAHCSVLVVRASGN